MNKQQLAAKIWASANKMRSKIEANEYKDYILGFIFYKFLSDKEFTQLKKDGWETEDFLELTEEDTETVEYLHRKLGYFIPYNHLFSTWISEGFDFDVSNVRDALSSFARNINPTHKRVFKNIFHTLETGLSKLGGTASEQTKAIKKLLKLIKDIPTDDSQDYDVLGFIYEYLISNFAANAGKKAGEFYTPHEVALLMAEIVADHLKDKTEIKIYDPTSGSGSLLLNIGKAVAKHVSNKDSVKYYAQELKEPTYNLTRMNLVMRGIIPDNITVRNGDTLEKDWPYFEEDENGVVIDGSYDMLDVNAVVSNPPYSQGWEPKGKQSDPRFKGYGLAPQGKADYAFLLHNLYHIKQDGIVTIVLPHGVLFRGGEDEVIRRNLVERNNIDAIISLPGNIFFGTPIATIIMILKKQRADENVLVVDASKFGVKSGKNYKLTSSEIRLIADTVINRTEKHKFSCLVSRETIRKNNYNLYIPRYIDSSIPAETWDLYASMYGGIPMSEIDKMHEIWEVFPSLRKDLFKDRPNSPCEDVATSDLTSTINENQEVKEWKHSILKELETLPDYLHSQLIENMMNINVLKEETILTDDLFARLGNMPLLNKYDAYQTLSNHWMGIDPDVWAGISSDLEIIKSEGYDCIKMVDPNMVPKKSNKEEDDDQEVQKGWKGHILPFDLIQQTILIDDYRELQNKISELESVQSRFSLIIEESNPDEIEPYLNDSNDAFDSVKVYLALDEALKNIESDEISALNAYVELLDRKATKVEKLDFIANHNEVDWSRMEQSKDGSYAKYKITNRLYEIKVEYQFPEGSIESVLNEVSNLFSEEKRLKSEIKVMTEKLHLKTKDTIESLSDDNIQYLLKKKWIEPLCEELDELPQMIINSVVSKLSCLVDKYSCNFIDIEQKYNDAKHKVSALLSELEADEYNSKAISDLLDSVSPQAILPLMGKILPLNCSEYSEGPTIRFRGVSGKWEWHPLNYYLETSYERNERDIYNKYDIFSVSGDYGVVNQIAFQGKSFAGASLLKYKVTHKNDIIYTKSPLKLEPYGIIKTNKAGDGIVSQLYAVYHPKDNVDPCFVESYFNLDNRLNDYLRPIVNKGAKNTLLVSDEDAISGMVLFPTDVREQKKISELIDAFTELLDASELMQTKYKNLRSAFLEGSFAEK